MPNLQEASKPSLSALLGPLPEEDQSIFNLAHIKELARKDPAKAKLLLDLWEGITKQEGLEKEREHHARLQVSMLQEVTKTQRELRAAQAACGQVGHRRGQLLGIGAQYDSQHQLVACCVICGQLWHGIGDGKDQLPQALANQLNTDKIGQ